MMVVMVVSISGVAIARSSYSCSYINLRELLALPQGRKFMQALHSIALHNIA